MNLIAANTIGARPGMRVKVQVETRELLVGSTVVYILPIVFFVGGYYMGWSLGPSIGLAGQAGGIIGAFAALVASFPAVRYLTARLSKKSAMVQISGPAGPEV